MSSQPGVPMGSPVVEVAPGVLAETARRFMANRLSVAGLLIVIGLAIAAVLADVLSPYPRDFAVFSQVLKPPSPQHLLGTDAVGRDFLTRILHAARTSMLVGLSVPLLSAVVGIPLGAAAAWRGGRADALFLRVVEIFTAVPPYMLVILLVSIWGSGLDRIILFLGATGWVGLARLARAQVVGLRPREFVTSAHALGASDWRVLSQHILPNAAGAMVVVLVMSVPSAIFAEAGLSVLGLGVKDPIPSWGKMLTEGMPYAASHPLLALVPIGLIALTMLAFSFVGDGLRDAFDPHSRL
jgi:oligopeptide transport system permease protein